MSAYFGACLLFWTLVFGVDLEVGGTSSMQFKVVAVLDPLNKREAGLTLMLGTESDFLLKYVSRI